MKAHSCFLPLLTLLLTSLGAQSPALRLHGSDLLDPSLPSWLNQQAAADPRLPEIHCNLKGSAIAWAAMQRGHADAMLYLGNLTTDATSRLESIPVAFLATYLYVDSTAPATSIRAEQLATIARQHAPQPIRRWVDWTSSEEDWANRPVRLIIEAGYRGIHVSQFNSLLLGSIEFSEQVTVVSNDEQLMSELNRDSGFILASPRRTPPAPGLRLLAIAAQGETVPFPPTLENMIHGDYPGTVPLNLISLKDSTWSNSLRDLLTSQEIQPLLESLHLIPYPH